MTGKHLCQKRNHAFIFRAKKNHFFRSGEGDSQERNEVKLRHLTYVSITSILKFPKDFSLLECLAVRIKGRKIRSKIGLVLCNLFLKTH